MAFSTSAVFGALLEDALENTAALDLNLDGCKVALFNNTTVPDEDAITADTLFSAGTWPVGNEEISTTDWPTGGEPLDTPTLTRTGGVLKFDGVDTVQNGTTCTLADVYGSMIYDDDVADQGLCFNDFGGVQAVTAGDFTVQWHTNGIFTITFTAA